MLPLASFLVAVVVSMADPLLLLGCILAGALLRNVLAALVAAAAQAVALEILVWQAAIEVQANYSMQFLPVRLVAAALITVLTFWIARWARHDSTARRDRSAGLLQPGKADKADT